MAEKFELDVGTVIIEVAEKLLKETGWKCSAKRTTFNRDSRWTKDEYTLKLTAAVAMALWDVYGIERISDE